MLGGRLELAAAVLFLGAFAIHASAQESGRSIVLTPDSDYFGFDLRVERDVTLEKCQSECIGDPSCRAFTYNGRAERCFLKSDFNRLVPFAGAVAGRVVAAPAETDIGAPPRLAFLPAYLEDEARRYRSDLIRVAPAGETGVAALEELAELALSRGDGLAAIDYLRKAIAITPDEQRLWSRLTAASFAAAQSGATREWTMKPVATSAALNAYQVTRHARDRAATLATLASALEWRELFRPAISALEASLELADSRDIRERYEDLRRRHGFRVLDHTVDSDSRNPRICVQFSEALPRAGVDYSAFVTLDGGAAANVEAGEREICLDGLAHGNRYRIALRAGLPSTVGEVLQAPVTLDVYVRDRAPFVRFTGDNFVLPGSGRHGIPVVTVNTQSVSLELFRIGDRSIAGLLSRSRFLRQIDGYQARAIAEESGELVWRGVLETGVEPNREVVTSFPVDEALPERLPGVYVLTAVPEAARTDDWEARATQWFVISDIGLTAVSGEDGLTAFARSLASAEPIADLELTLIARNNEVLARIDTDAAGQAAIPAGLMRGTGGMAPQAILAQRGTADFVFLDLGRAGFDLSDRGVEGRPAPGALDVMAWTERGIYRAGETVHITALVRDSAATAVDSMPLTFVFTRPDGVEYRREASTAPAMGGHHLTLALPENAMLGPWTLRVHTDPEQSALAERRFLVEDFIPDRIEFDLASDRPVLSQGEPATISVSGRFLYGAPAAGLAIEGEAVIRPTREWSAFPGYRFGLADEGEGESTRLRIGNLPALDESGNAAFPFTADVMPATTALLAADVILRLREAGGRAVERRLMLPIRPEGPRVGIAPRFEGQSVPENSSASFSVIALGPEGMRTPVDGANWSLLRLERNYQWYREGSSWRYETVDYTTRIADGTVDIPADAPAMISAPVGWGRYRLEIETPAGAAASFDFEAGWMVEANAIDTPDGLEIALDKETYRPGEMAQLRISPRFAGKLAVTVGADAVLATLAADVPAEGATVAIPVGNGWGAGAYVTATLLRPGDAERSRMPMRAMGVKWLAVDPGDRRLDVEMALPERIRPGGVLEVPVSVAGAGAGENAFVTLAAVDVGILNLTRYEAPDADGWYFGQRRMGLEIRDIYGRLIDGSAGTPGRIRSGGDGPAMTSEGSPPAQRLVAFHSGIVALDDQGKATIRFEIPQFNGTIRLMAVAWSGSGVGDAAADVIVRDPVVLTAGIPRFLAPGDIADLRLDAVNTDGPAGDYRLTVSASGPLAVARDVRTLRLGQGARAQIVLPVNATAPGTGRLTLTLEDDEGGRLEQVHEIPVRPATLPVARVFDLPLAGNGGSLRIDTGLIGGSLVEGASVSLSVRPESALDIPALLMTLDRYPYGCAEQVTSRALPLLYLSELAVAAGLEEDPDANERIRQAIGRVLSFQSSSGAFGLWGPGSGDLWLDAYVTDFLTRARERHFEVPDLALRQALDGLQNSLAYTTDIGAEGPAIAYALYVLARNRRASAGDLRYYADTQIDAFASPMARAHIAASLALYGDSERAGRAFASAYRRAADANNHDPARSDYGSALRDNAAVLALAAESRHAEEMKPAMMALLADSLAARRRTSTQEQAWMLLAARAIEAGTPIEIEIDGEPHSGNFATRVSGEALARKPITLVNRGETTVSARVTAVAAPEDPLPAGGTGFSITRTYHTLDGAGTNVSEVRQNDRFVVVLRVVEENTWPSRVLVSDLLPAGFEIDNPRLVSSAELAGFGWLPDTAPAHTEFRDDRFVAAFDRGAGSPREMVLAYVVRAVTTGVYAHPAASVEDMYRPELSARTASGFVTVEAD